MFSPIFVKKKKKISRHDFAAPLMMKFGSYQRNKGIHFVTAL